jgi:hypothetical protein
MNKYTINIDTFKYTPSVEKEQRFFLLAHQRPEEVDMSPEFLSSLKWDYISKNDMSDDFIIRFRKYISYVNLALQRRIDLHSDEIVIKTADAFLNDLKENPNDDGLLKKVQTFTSAFAYNKKLSHSAILKLNELPVEIDLFELMKKQDTIPVDLVEGKEDEMLSMIKKNSNFAFLFFSKVDADMEYFERFNVPSHSYTMFNKRANLSHFIKYRDTFIRKFGRNEYEIRLRHNTLLEMGELL